MSLVDELLADLEEEEDDVQTPGRAGEIAEAKQLCILLPGHQPNHPCTNQPSRASRKTQANWPLLNWAM